MAARLAVLSAVTLLAAGCGSSDNETGASDWASSVCSAVSTWKTSVSSAVINAYYGQRFDTDLRFALLTPGIALFGAVLSLLLGVLAGGIAAARLVRTRPLVLWRRG